MRSFKRKNAETAHLWLAIVIVCAMSLYRSASFLIPSLHSFLQPYLQMAISEWFVNAVFFYLLVLLWVAYYRWQRTIMRRRDLELILETISPDVLLVVSPERQIVECSDAVKEVFGYAPDEVIGRPTDLLYFDRRVTGQEHEIFSHIERMGFHTGRAKGRRKDGSEFPLEIVTVKMKRQDGVVIMIRDITERHRAEEKILRAKEEAEAAHAEKSRLLQELEVNYRKLQDMEKARDGLTHMIVHDLKSPLTSIIAHLDLLRHTAARKLSEEEAGFLGEAIRMGDRLTWMINSLLDISRLESGQMPLSREPFAPASLVDEALRSVGPESSKREVSLHIAPEASSVVCDGGVIGRVLMNLIGNAVKFTGEGGSIRVVVSREGAGTRFGVTDTGPGIAPEFHEKIFARFAQLERTPFSTGLGLTFCKLAVEAHGGKIGVQSEAGKGSTFWFVLP